MNLLIYGESGVGKTTFLGTAEDLEETMPALLIDVEGGIVTLRKRTNLDIKPIRSMKEMIDLINDLRKYPGYYKTVMLDSVTELQKLDMRVIMKAAYDANPDKVDIDVPSPREWGKCGEHIRNVVRALRDLPCNTIITALPNEEKNKEGVVLKIGPDLPGKLKSHIPGFMDIVGYMMVDHIGGNTTRKIQFAKTKKVMAKDRTGVLDDVTLSPSIPLLWERIHG